MKKLLLGLLSGFFLLIACKDSGKKKTEISKDNYSKQVSENKPATKNGSGEFEISAPAGWTKSDTFLMGQRIVFIKSPREDNNDDFIENVNVVTEKIGNMQMDEYFELSVANIKKGLNEVEIGKTSDKSISGLEFKSMRYSHVYGGVTVDVDVYFTADNGTAYVITCSAKGGTISRWESEFEEIIRSFKLN